MNDNAAVNPASARRAADRLATQLLVDTIWKTASIEVRGLTSSQTKSIFNGVAPAGMSVKDIIVVNNVQHAWQFLLTHDVWAPDWQAVSQYNSIIGAGLYANPGKIRTFSVRISGTDWTPLIPTSREPQDEIKRIMGSSMDPVDRATALLTRIMRGQWFQDGNKRTALMVANHSLVHDGIGVLAIRQQDMPTFMSMLIDYYETGEDKTIRTWLAYHAIEHLPEGLTLADAQKRQRKQIHR